MAKQAAEDTVQNTWLKLVEHATSITDPQSVLKWLTTTTKRDAWHLVARSHREEPALGADVRDVDHRRDLALPRRRRPRRGRPPAGLGPLPQTPRALPDPPAR